MVGAYYFSALLVSVILMLVYCFLYHRHFDIHLSFLFALVPLNNLAQLLCCQSKTLDEAILANKMVYVSNSYLILNITLLVFSLCSVKLNQYVKLLLYIITTLVLACALQIGENELFYKSVELSIQDGCASLVKTYGPLHVFYYAMLVVYFLIGLGVILYSFFKNAQISRGFIVMMAIPETFSLLSFFLGRSLFPSIELIPFFYDLTLIVYLIIAHRLVLYNINETVIDTIVQKGETGFISFDFKYRYLGSNDTAKLIFPNLVGLKIDKTIPVTAGMDDSVMKWLYEFSEDNSRDKVYYHDDDKEYLVTVGYLYNGKSKKGYQLFITDDTKNRQYITLINSFNRELKAEVAQKTANIIEMHNNLVLAMASMVESRDNSTGGHIRRTSEGVRFLVEAMRGSQEFQINDTFCHNLIKAAPMHDLGKIAVDDAVLRKPGRFTPEEFEKMKTHAAEGAKIVHEILKTTDDEEFRKVAENVAHFHHERWDGSGYPLGLKGDQIPLEARIMAIADVFDALVSKRVYKEAMSFETANRIILEGMGKQFDKRLEKYYNAAFMRLVEYYTTVNND